MFKIKSSVTNLKYDPAEIVYITLVPQVVVYMKHNAQIVDVSVEKNKLAIGFWRKDHERLKNVWNNRQLDYEGDKIE